VYNGCPLFAKFAEITFESPMDKIKVGIIFGGNSREREVSFAGGRTVYDNLNKSVFEAVPLFVDSFGNIILLQWEYIYKGSIRDFYPPVESLPPSPNEYQVYAEILDLKNKKDAIALTNSLGKLVVPSSLDEIIDFAFLCLHGTNGEDGRIQGLLEYFKIPYSGSGILPSAIGMNKAIQKRLMSDAGFQTPDYFTLPRNAWMNSSDRPGIMASLKAVTGFPCVVKAANQGSSIGISVLHQDDDKNLEKAIDQAFFARRISKQEWNSIDNEAQPEFIRSLSDIREGIGMPVIASSASYHSGRILHPEKLLEFLSNHFTKSEEAIFLEGCDSESEVLAESFIEGREFSCIVVRNDNGLAVALPPTEIRKGRELFDYRSKYLPGLSRKITPIDLPYEKIQAIRKECERLFNSLHFHVYARIDGFINEEGTVFLNDPNTTSGMMPSSFFFHQAAEIGLNPSQFLSYIIRTSLSERIGDFKDIDRLPAVLQKLDNHLSELKGERTHKIAVAVIFGGFSSERHISVESGRNIYEKLSSSEKYDPVPVFLTGDTGAYKLFQVPVNLLLKDNADDIREKIEHFRVHEVTAEIMHQCEGITSKYTSAQNVLEPRELSFEQLAGLVDFAFIALHGRPGEDGAIQQKLEAVKVPYNGSGIQSSRLTINKYDTNEVLHKNGFHVARHRLVNEEEWKSGAKDLIENILSEYTLPLIAKPVDDGCSSAVKKIRNRQELEAFAELIFRQRDELIPEPAGLLQLKIKEEFPRKKQFLIEELIEKNGANHFLEITGGLLTHLNEKDEREYEMFEASEALSEGDVLSLEEKFLAGEGQNITPARYHEDPVIRKKISDGVKDEFLKAAKVLNIEGYARIDAFVRIYSPDRTEVIFVEVNSLPGMTPATCIFHQSAINGYKPFEFIDGIIEYGMRKKMRGAKVN
jgi:UDP-N-acetylmuramate--alanine ligase